MSEYKRHTIRRNGKIQQVCDGCSLFASGLCKVVDCKQTRKETAKELWKCLYEESVLYTSETVQTITLATYKLKKIGRKFGVKLEVEE